MPFFLTHTPAIPYNNSNSHAPHPFERLRKNTRTQARPFLGFLAQNSVQANNRAAPFAQVPFADTIFNCHIPYFNLKFERYGLAIGSRASRNGGPGDGTRPWRMPILQTGPPDEMGYGTALRSQKEYPRSIRQFSL
ncbi:hypothetical protein LSM04_005628 [Trypanosoma melophagium]|uniref:uncharacterized protein n=1 Tax=Trypanosoma melophagium TaxID=715481 RepID=UPI00351A8B62|nr:hypothetical protein LSM04_004840 [Trypanosoma melophagium]KAH9584255.1 hypothetical protein LSM04_005628 [Trypanosoma melophagium]